MSFKLKLKYNKKIKNGVSPNEALERLSDIERIADLHPKVKSVTNIGEDSWQWTMKPSGARGSFFDIIYACSYTVNNKEFFIRWVPVYNIGNAIVYGSWEVINDVAEINLDITIKIPFPHIFSGIANKIANKAFDFSMKRHLKQLEELISK